MSKEKNSIEALEKQKQQQEKARIQLDMIEKAKTRCKDCGFYKFEDPRCRCGGGGGGGSGEEKDSGEKASSPDSKSQTSILGQINTGSLESIAESIESKAFMPLLDDIRFNSEVLSEKLLNKLLVSWESGIFIIQLRFDPNTLSAGDPNLLSAEQKHELKKFVNAILEELKEFKNENGITDECKELNQDKDGNILSLRITLPTRQLYNDFIQRLAGKHLLPKQNVKQQAEEKVGYSKDLNHFNTPLSTRPSPSKKCDKKAKKDDQQSHETKKVSTSSIEENKPSSFRP